MKIDFYGMKWFYSILNSCVIVWVYFVNLVLGVVLGCILIFFFSIYWNIFDFEFVY